MQEELIEHFLFENVKINNDNKEKKYFIEGTFSYANRLNKNKRVYKPSILKKAVNEAQEKIKLNAMTGSIDHPESNPEMKLSQASHKIIELKMLGEDQIYGKAMVLSGPPGKHLESLINDNVAIGISSRGLGTLKKVGDIYEVQDDYKLITFDVVGSPSAGTYLNSIQENEDLSEDLNLADALTEITAPFNQI